MLSIESFKQIMIKQEIYRRLINHSRYYCKEDMNSFDDIIVKLLNFYEENQQNNQSLIYLEEKEEEEERNIND